MTHKDKWLLMHSDKKHQPVYPSDVVVKFVFKNLAKNARVLDLGCGAGRHVKFLAENGFEAYGADYSQNGIECSKDLLQRYDLKADLRVSSVDDLDFEDEFFDGVICFGVLYYNDIKTIEKASLEIYRVLKKQGKAFVVLRSLDDYRYKLSSKKNKYEALIEEKNPKRSAFSEDGMKNYFVDEKEIKRIFEPFLECEINLMQISFENNTISDSDFLITLVK